MDQNQPTRYSLWEALAHSPKGAAQYEGENGFKCVVTLQDGGYYLLEWETPTPQGAGMNRLPPLMSKTELTNAIKQQGLSVDLNAQVWQPVT
jgi:hypothetical protein